jgi:predicted anti-sigma-YlaC factor YlaD
MNATNENICQNEDVAAYLDGELDARAQSDFETHLKVCSRCARQLRTQRQLLCTLDAAFDESRFALPRDFTRVVSTHAQSDVRRMRDKSERGHAFRLCAVLALAAFALMGAASGKMIVQPARAFLSLVLNLLDLVWRTAYDAGTGVVVVMRLIGRALIIDTHGLGLLILLPLVILVFLLPRLIVNYHRAQIIE